MTSQFRTQRLRVALPTLEPDPVFLGMLVDLSASSRPTPRTTRSAGLRLVAATASVATIAAATWATGIVTAVETPLPTAGSPLVQEETSGPSSQGDVGTPQPDVTTLPGSPLSPGLPGTTPATDLSMALDVAPSAVPSPTAGADAGEAATGQRGKSQREPRVRAPKTPPGANPAPTTPRGPEVRVEPQKPPQASAKPPRPQKPGKSKPGKPGKSAKSGKAATKPSGAADSAGPRKGRTGTPTKGHGAGKRASSPRR